MRIENRQHLAQCREDYRKALECQYKKVLICCGSGCVASGSMNVYSRMKELLHERGLRVDVELQHEGHEESVGLKRLPRILPDGASDAYRAYGPYVYKGFC